MKKRLIFIKHANSSFIVGDQHILEEMFHITPILLNQDKDKKKYGINLIKLFFQLLGYLFTPNTLFVSWFADYHSAIMVLAGKLTGSKSVIFIGGQEAVSYPELRKGVYQKKIRAACVRFALKNASLVIANHQSLIYHENYYYNQQTPHIDGIKHYVSGLKTPVEIVYNGINPDRIVRDRSIAKQDNMVLTVGTMQHTGDFYNKGFDLFIEAAVQMPGLKFVLIGLNRAFTGWLEEKYQVSAISNLEIIPSFCPQDVLNKAYNQAKVFVQASITEGMPNTLSEAMLLECIPVGSNVNGIPDAIGDTGVTIKRRAATDLVSGIQQAIQMETGDRARQRVLELFSIEQRRHSLLKIFSKL